MDEEKMTLQDVADYVENEGLGYAIQHGTSGDDFEDEELRKWWKEAKVILDKIHKKIESHLP